jgi:hypothetical protein
MLAAFLPSAPRIALHTRFNDAQTAIPLDLTVNLAELVAKRRTNGNRNCSNESVVDAIDRTLGFVFGQT